MAKEKTLYQERYRKGSLFVDEDKLPTMHHVPDGIDVESVEVKEAGVLDVGGERREYQVLHVVLKESNNG